MGFRKSERRLAAECGRTPSDGIGELQGHQVDMVQIPFEAPAQGVAGEVAGGADVEIGVAVGGDGAHGCIAGCDVGSGIDVFIALSLVTEVTEVDAGVDGGGG